VVSYNASLGLGFAATVEVYTNNGGTTPDGILNDFKGVWCLGGDLAGLGSSSSVAYLVKELLQTLRSGDVDGEEEQRLPSPGPNQLGLSSTKKLALSLRTWPSQTNLAQRDNRSVSIPPYYDRQPPLPSPQSPSSLIRLSFEREKEKQGP
jgi:hypothetical protein